MRAATIPEQMGAIDCCPACSTKLSRASSPDPFAICLVCPNRHRFFVMPEPANAVQTAKAVSAHFPNLEDQTSEQVATFWLSDPAARGILNEQLATLLRVILEGYAREDALPFLFCPMCCGELAYYDDGDIWVRACRCPRGHRWGERGGRLGCPLQGQRAFALWAEPSRSVVRQHIAGWLQGNPHLDTNLHESVRKILANSVFRDGDA